MTVTIVKTGRLRIRTPAITGSVTLYPWCEARVPPGWDGTAGQVLRLKLPGGANRPGRVAVALIQSLLPSSSFLIDGSTEEGSGEDLDLSCAGLATTSSQPAQPADATLSQRVPVVAGCAYRLTFRWQIAFLDEQTPFEIASDTLAAIEPAPRWEILWWGAGESPIATDTQDLDFLNQINAEQPAPWPAEFCLVAPAGATQAELRFVYPLQSPGAPRFIVLLEQVAFAPTMQAVCNGQFRQWEIEGNGNAARGLVVPVGWTRRSGVLARQRDALTGQPVLELRASGPDDAVLAQVMPAAAGETYRLAVTARPVPRPQGDPESTPAAQRSRLELRWLAAPATPATAGAAIGPAVTVNLDGRDFLAHAWSGMSPAGAAQAEIRLVQPSGQGALRVASVALDRVDQVAVPLIFLAEAPGQLTISNLRVAYDLPSPQVEGSASAPAQAAQAGAAVRGLRALRPSSGPAVGAPAPAAAPPVVSAPAPGPLPVAAPLAAAEAPPPAAPVSPGPAAASAAGAAAAPAAAPPAESGAAVTPAEAPPAESVAAVTPAEAPAPEVQAGAPLVAPPEAVPVRETSGEGVSDFPPGGPPAPEAPSLTDIPGIGDARARRLADGAINSVAALAAARPEDVAAALRGVTPETAARFIAAAQELLAARAPAPAAPSGLPLTAIGGIGEARALRLADAGFDTVEKLAAATPDELAQVLRGVSREVAAHFVAEAREMLKLP